MPITILPPVVEADPYVSSDDDFEDSDGDVDMDLDANKPRPSKKLRLSKGGVVTPGEIITDDPQWMRYTDFSFPFLDVISLCFFPSSS